MSNLSKREIKRLETEENAMELLVIKLLLFKFGMDETASNDASFVAFLNELPNPPVTITGAAYTYMGYRQMMSRIPEERLMYMYDKITSEPTAMLFKL